MKPDGSDVKRLTTFEDYDVRWPRWATAGSFINTKWTSGFSIRPQAGMSR